MQRLLLLSGVFLFSCNSKSPDKKNEKQTDTASSKTDTVSAIKPAVQKDTVAQYTAPGEASVNQSLQAEFGDKWHVLNDREASWMKDAFEYFIVPKRKEFPDYPYITRGDFNGDGKEDTAAVIVDADKKKYQLAVLTGGKKATLWDEDIMADAAISTVPKSTIEALYGEVTKKIKLKNPSINVEYYERASFVLYFEKGKLKRVQTGD